MMHRQSATAETRARLQMPAQNGTADTQAADGTGAAAVDKRNKALEKPPGGATGIPRTYSENQNVPQAVFSF